MHYKRYLLPSLCLVSLILTSCGGVLYTPPTAAVHCDIDPALLEPKAPTEAEGKTTIELWATAERQYCWRVYAPLVTAHQRPDLALSVRIHNLEINEGPLGERLMELSTRGNAPDIAYLFNQAAVKLGKAGHLYSLNNCRKKPEFHDIPDEFWTNFSDDGQAWGIPIDMEAIFLFYNKTILAQLGWTDSQIDELPARIDSGDFLLDDLIATARKAVATNVVQPGLALIPNRVQRTTIESLYVHGGGQFVDQERQQLLIQHNALEQTYSFLAALHRHQLLDATLAIPSFGDWGNKLILRDAAAYNRVLFWQAHASEFPRLAMDYQTINHGDINVQSDTAMLNKQIGIALIPATTKNRMAYTRLVNSGQYVIFAPQATGRTNQEAACDLFAATYNSDLLKKHGQKSGLITFVDGGFYLPDWFSSQLSLDSLIWLPPYFPKINEYSEIIVETGVRVELGELNASEAVGVAIQRLRDTFGSQIIVE